MTIPAMTPPIVHDYLEEIGKEWTGRGVAMELGSWLGATAVPLLKGLKKAKYDKPFYCYDRWLANSEQAIKAKKQGVNIVDGENLLPLFLNNVNKVYDKVQHHQGNISGTIESYKGGDIEICIFDAPKQDPVFSNVVTKIHKNWIPGLTIIGFLDFYFYKEKKNDKRERLKRPVKFIQDNKECFTKLAEWPNQCECVFFRYEKELKKI